MSGTSRSKAVGAPLGPGSLLWSTAGDPRALLTGSTAGILQLMYPGLGAAITDHSDFFEDPFARIFRSIPVIWASIFADEDEGSEVGHKIRDFHPDVKGTDHAGRNYHALDPDVYWWAHATFTWEMFRARELYFPGKLSTAQREQLYAETVTWYRRYGVSDRPVPATVDEFDARFHEICATELELTPAVRWVLDPTKNPAAKTEDVQLPGALRAFSGIASRAMAKSVHRIVYGSMPDVVRRRFDLPWTNGDRVGFAALSSALMVSGPAIRRGAMSDMWPQGTPHLKPGTTDEVIIAGPGIREKRLAEAAAESATSG
jgi:uncharacterized protein (DUF2236 family)